MDFDKQIHNLLRPGNGQDKTFPTQFPPLSAQFDRAIAQTMAPIRRVLSVLSRHLEGSTIIEPGLRSDEPSFYVTALRVPQLPDKGFHHPLRLYFVIMPHYRPRFGLHIVRVVAVGRGTDFMPIGSFLRAWNEIGVGGAVIYDGEHDPDAVRIAVEQSAMRFLNRRQEIMDWYDKGLHQGHPLVWPIDHNFKPSLCSVCLLPGEHNIKCPKCGTRRTHP